MWPSISHLPHQRLLDTTGVQRVPTRELELFVVRDFLGPDICDALIRLVDEKRRPSEIANDTGIANFRTSETCDLDPSHPIVRAVDAKISHLTGIPPELGELIQGQRYAPGQEFRAHTDTFNPGSHDFYVHTAELGQRTWTAMVYLNEPEEGGATRFTKIGKSIKPERGKMLVWNNLLPDGSPNMATLHQGMKVRRGTKYILTKWFRELPCVVAPS